MSSESATLETPRRIDRMLNAIEAGGGTDLHGGLVRAYQLANQQYSKDKINMDKFLSTNLYCPTTELEDDDCVACGTKDDDIAYLIRDINPDGVNYYHFECVETTHSDFSVGVA